METNTITHNAMGSTMRIPELARLILIHSTTNEVDSLRLTSKSIYNSLEVYYLRRVMDTLCHHPKLGQSNMKLVNHHYKTFPSGRTTLLNRVIKKVTFRTPCSPDNQCEGHKKNGERCTYYGYQYGDTFPRVRYCKHHTPK